MPGRQEILQAFTGAFLLARLDVRGMGLFDLSMTGFWRSFFAPVLVAPVYLLTVPLRQSAERTPDLAEIPLGRLFLLESLDYVIAWLAFPVVMVLVAKWLDLGERYAGYIVAYNWCQALALLALTPLMVLDGTGLAPPLTGLVMFVAVLAVTYYSWFVAKTALAITWHLAVALVLLDIICTLAVGAGLDLLLL